MSTPNESPSEQQAPAVTPAQTDTAQPAGEHQQVDHEAAIKSMDHGQLAGLLFGTDTGSDQAEPAPAEAEPEMKEEAEAAPTEVVAEVKEEDTPEGEEPQADPSKPAADTSKGFSRLSVKALPQNEQQNLADAIEMVRNGTATSIMEAMQKVAGTPAMTATEEEPATGEQPVAQVTPTAPLTVSALETEIATLREKRDQADDDFDKTEVRRLTALIEDTGVRLAEARIREHSEKLNQVDWNSQYNTAVTEVETKYSWAVDESSPLFQVLDDRVTAAQARKDPALANPRFILDYAAEVEAMFAPKEAPSPSPVVTPKQPVPAPPSRPVGTGVAPVHTDASKPSEAELKMMIDKATPEQLGAALFGTR